MINLLPPELKSGYSFARTNVLLRNWVVLFAISIIGLALIGTYGLLAIKQSGKNYEKDIAVSEQYLADEDYDAVQKRVQDIGGSFKLVVNVLSQEVLFSKLIKQIATTIPKNANLTGLTISQTQGAIDISANAIDYTTATQVQINLADPANKIFSKADIVNINCEAKAVAADGSVNQYPCSVNIKALFGSNTDYLFINSKGKKK